MNQLISLPTTRCFVRRRFIQQDTEPAGFIESYLVAVMTVANEAPKLMVMTNEGAMFCYVPPQAVAFTEDAMPFDRVCRWDCISDQGEVVELEFLRNFRVEWDGGAGRYMWTLHFSPHTQWGRLPEQDKLFHFIEGEDGNLHIKVNNECQWKCDAIHDGPLTFVPESNKTIWYNE